MGAIAEALVLYAQPLIDETDGSIEQMQKAFAVSTFCYNLANLPEEMRDVALGEMKISLKMGDKEFDVFRRSVVTPMIQRHQTMFSNRDIPVPSNFTNSGPRRRTSPIADISDEETPKTDRYAPCPCNSGLKYKFCCGKK